MAPTRRSWQAATTTSSGASYQDLLFFNSLNRVVVPVYLSSLLNSPFAGCSTEAHGRKWLWRLPEKWPSQRRCSNRERCQRNKNPWIFGILNIILGVLWWQEEKGRDLCWLPRFQQEDSPHRLASTGLLLFEPELASVKKILHMNLNVINLHICRRTSLRLLPRTISSSSRWLFDLDALSSTPWKIGEIVFLIFQENY